MAINKIKNFVHQNKTNDLLLKSKSAFVILRVFVAVGLFSFWTIGCAVSFYKPNVHNIILAAGFSYLACCILIYMSFLIFLAPELLSYIDDSVRFSPDKRIVKLRQKTNIFFRTIILLATGYSLCSFSFSIWQAATSSLNHLGLSYASYIFLVFEIPIEVITMIVITYVTKKVASGDIGNTSSTSGQQNNNEKGALSTEEFEVLAGIRRSSGRIESQGTQNTLQGHLQVHTVDI